MGKARPVAPGVWLVRGGRPLPTMNVYLIEDEGGGITMFDAGVKSMAGSLRKACAELGGLNRIVLGHAHVDHRGAAPQLDAPVYCHPDEVADAESDGGFHYQDTSRLAPHARVVMPRLMKMWDGGAVRVSGTVSEGDDVSGFKVVEAPGHAPGLIVLYREKDGLALTTDVFYTIDAQSGLPVSPRLAYSAFHYHEEAARAALRKVAELDPSAAWPGHAQPVTEHVKETLLKGAERV
ncbi:MAG: MBL fold metallo-hydrolase [Actinomycetota bacterium]|nr:MBL fold metallo-hydrolase [Actinomycetota bacterium]